MKYRFSMLLLFALICLPELNLLAQKKNVLVIMVDDLNHWISPIGYANDAITPNINQLAHKGVLFRDASSPSPVCNPSRNAILSGLRPSTTDISRNGDGFIRDKEGFENVVTMNQYFGEQGYFTYAGGKIYHPSRIGDAATDPNNWSGFTTLRTGSSGGSIYRWESDENGAYVWSAGEFDIEGTNDTKLARHFAERINQYDKDQPFFMAVGFFRPHLPWDCHKDFFDLYDPDTLDIPKGYLENDAEDILGEYNGQNTFAEVNQEGQWKNAIRAYLANMSYADFNVGIVLNALENSAFKDNTIVVFMGDHGWHLGEKDRLSKHAVFDLASRTTFIIYDPDAEGNGTICPKPVGLQDVYPTLIDLCELQERNVVEGSSLVPLLENPLKEDWDEPVLLKYGNVHIIKTNKWRFIDDGNNSQLYDIENDPYEFHNLYNETGYGAIISLLRDEITQMLAEGAEVKKNLTTSVRDFYQNLPQLSIFPNPVEERLIINSPSGNRPFTIYNIKGQIVLSGKTERNHLNQMALDVQRLDKGAYLLKIDGFRPSQFIKQ